MYVLDPSNPATFPEDSNEFTAVKVELGEDAIIPCIPSHPSFEVKLRRGRDQYHLKQPLVLNPATGFLMPGVNSTNVGGDYECLFSSAQLFEQKRLLKLLVVERHDSEDEPPGEDENGSRDNVVGESGPRSAPQKSFRMYFLAFTTLMFALS